MSLFPPYTIAGSTMTIETARDVRNAERGSPCRYRNVALLVSTLLGTTMQCVARVASRFSGTNLQKRDNYLLFFVIGVIVMSLSAGIALYLVLRPRLSNFAGGFILTIIAAILVTAAVAFCGLYWPWMLGMY